MGIKKCIWGCVQEKISLSFTVYVDVFWVWKICLRERTWELGYFTGICVNRLLCVECFSVLWVETPCLCSHHESPQLTVYILSIRWQRSQRWPWHTWSWPPRRDGPPWNTRYEGRFSVSGWVNINHRGRGWDTLRRNRAPTNCLRKYFSSPWGMPPKSKVSITDLLFQNNQKKICWCF